MKRKLITSSAFQGPVLLLGQCHKKENEREAPAATWQLTICVCVCVSANAHALLCCSVNVG